MMIAEVTEVMADEKSQAETERFETVALIMDSRGPFEVADSAHPNCSIAAQISSMDKA